VVRANEETRVALGTYTYDLTYSFSLYETMDGRTPTMRAGHKGIVSSSATSLFSDLTTTTDKKLEAYPSGAFRNVFVRNPDYLAYAETRPGVGGAERFASALRIDLSNGEGRGELSKAVEGSRSFDLVAYAFGPDRFQTLREQLEVAEIQSDLALFANADGSISIRVHPRHWESGAPSVEYVLDPRKGSLITGRTYWAQGGEVLCSFSLVAEERSGKWYPVSAEEKRFKRSAATQSYVLFREWKATAAPPKGQAKPSTMASLPIPEGINVPYYARGERLLKHGATMEQGKARPAQAGGGRILDADEQEVAPEFLSTP